MDSNQEDLSRLIRHLMRGNADPLIQEFGLEDILNALAKYCGNQAVCCRLSEDEEGWQRWNNTENLLRKAGENWAPEPTQETFSEIYAETIKRFLSRLSGNELNALGSPPRVSINLELCQVVSSCAEKSGGWYEEGKWYQLESLLLFAPTYDHHCALAAAYPAYKKAARGLFRAISFKYPGCKSGFSVAVE
jgi:hypothetical protein